MRTYDARLKWFLSHVPTGPGRCAEYTMWSLDVPKQGYDNAAQMARDVMAAGRMQQGAVPYGAVRYWVGGSDGNGHVALEAAPLNAPSSVASVDVNGGGTVGTRPMMWFRNNWPRLTYVGWSWYFGKINTQMEEVPVVANDYLSLKETTPRKIRTNKDIKIDIDGKTRWVAEVPEGRHNLGLYVNLNLPQAILTVGGVKKPNPQRKFINNGGVRYWFQQEDLAEVDDRDETGLIGPISPPKFGDQYFLMSHDWAHVVDKDFWEFCFRVYAYDDNGNEVDIELELRTREIKIIGDKT